MLAAQETNRKNAASGRAGTLSENPYRKFIYVPADRPEPPIITRLAGAFPTRTGARCSREEDTPPPCFSPRFSARGKASRERVRTLRRRFSRDRGALSWNGCIRTSPRKSVPPRKIRFGLPESERPSRRVPSRRERPRDRSPRKRIFSSPRVRVPPPPFFRV